MANKKVGLALGSGAAKGLAHIGVIKTLIKHNVPIDFISGSSMGGLIGSFYAKDKDIERLERLALTTDWKQLIKLLDPKLKNGFIDGIKVVKFIQDYLGEIDFVDTLIPVRIAATDVVSGQSAVFSEGPMIPAIRASIAMPMVFEPYSYQGMLLTDGSLSLPVPTRQARAMGADIVIAVDLDGDYRSNIEKAKMGIFEIAENSLELMRHHLAIWSTADADLMIKPRVGRMNWYDFWKAEELIAEGEAITEEAWPEIRRMLDGSK